MKQFLKASLLVLVSLSLFACSNANERASHIDPATGKHPSGWAVADNGGTHPGAYLASPSACFECHGEALTGGISRVSCFSASRSGITCHADGPSGHPAGWEAGDVHGAAAKALAAGKNGLARCQLCHGADFTGGVANTSCLNNAGCHGAGIQAAHPARPWRSRIGGRTHTTSDASNAAACAVCHAGGANSTRQPAPAAPAGTAPGCFNNTLCHGTEGHSLANWNTPALHGAAAKAAAGGATVAGQFSAESAFVNCAACHGQNFDGGSAEQSCLNTTGCHGVAAPHPARPWRSATGGLTHTTTDTGNAEQCARCHTAGANSTRAPRPGDRTGLTGCFNNTLCHGAEGHEAGWVAAAQHGAAAKSAPGASTGFSSCQLCHGPAFNNGTAPSCLNTLACHGLLVASPHPEKPWFSTTAGVPTHSTTDEGNVATCAICHTAGANSRVVPPNPAQGAAGCFNNTLCHFHAASFAPPALPPSVHGGQAKQDLRVCQGCHGNPGSTSFDGQGPGGISIVACSSCHTFAKAHPTAWQGSTTNPGDAVVYSHRSAKAIANACILCHDVTQGRTAPLAAAPSCFSTTFTNGLGQATTCHASGPGVAPHSVPYANHNATARGNPTYCLGCHSIDSNVTTGGGRVIPRCLTCHLTSPAQTPTGCSSCHSKPPSAAAYPNRAGLHGSHLALNVTENATQTALCEQCHSGLGLGTLDHLNRARARSGSTLPNPVAFGALARTGGVTPGYNAATQSCSATYCHGETLDRPATAILTPSWNAPFLTGNAATDCARCHGYPPATATHAGQAPTDCSECHPHVNASGTGFTDATRHINGAVDASGHVFPNPGSAHRTGSFGTGCRSASCHPADLAGSPYPVAAGTPPNCRACHLNASPSSDPRCSDCHGSPANDAAAATRAGRPIGGAAFPNRAGQHNRDDHIDLACSECHPFGSGDPRHGWSNRQRSGAAQVGGAGTSITQWNPAGNGGRGSCLPLCHDTESWN